MASSASTKNVFDRVLEKFLASLTAKEKTEFGSTTLYELQLAMARIQRQQTSRSKQRGMRRLEGFLEAMKEFDKVIQVFVNTSEILAFVWGPMKFLLQTACHFSEAWESLMTAYQRIGEQLPLLAQHETQFRNKTHQAHMEKVLSLMYKDILDFHWKAMRYFKQRVWKQLLSAVWKNFDTEFGEILRNLREHRSLIESQASIAQLHEMIRNQEISQTTLNNQKEGENRRRREFCMQWLSPAAYDVDQEAHTKVRLSYPGTGRWLLTNKRFYSWFDRDASSNQLLWMTGIPGAGKTILASLVIEEAKKLPNVAVAFFYCKYEDAERNTFVAVARGILLQLLNQDDDLLPYLYEEASKSGQSNLSTGSLAKKLLETAIKNHQKLYVIIDGIDECEREQRREIVATFESFWDSLPYDEADSLRCLFVSQDDSAARRDFARMVTLKITESDTKYDIRAYASVWSNKIKTKFSLDQDRKQYIEDMIAEKAEGMFLFARLMSRYLLDQNNAKELNQELLPTSFPRGTLRLEEIYGKITRKLFGETTTKESNPKKLLSWMVCAKRPLKWREIQCAVSIDLDEQTVDWKDGRFPVDSKDLCGSLVEIHSDDTVNLVHHTARRYLVDEQIVDSATEEISLTLLTVGYLSMPCFDADNSKEDIQTLISLGYYGFLDYAYAYWSRHLEKSLSSPQPEHMISELTEALQIFMEFNWIEPQSKINVPKSLEDLLKPLAKAQAHKEIMCAVYLARKQLHSSTKATHDESFLRIKGVLERIRTYLEEEQSVTSTPETFKLMYGSDLYKCPRPNCTLFYNGFPSKQLRDDHILKHERMYFCSFPGCINAITGCTTLKELKKHEKDTHGTIKLDDEEEDEFPETAPEVVSFVCETCQATFTRKHNLNNHIRGKHQGANTQSFLCRTCGKAFARKGDCTRHESVAHSSTSTFSCGGLLTDGSQWGCGKEFSRRDILTRHWKSEKGRRCYLPKQLEEQQAGSTPVSQPE
ncbi:hypothetical protein DM02DRAFT_673149 [Periconia macrospinosa]|uniref:C2H2-type domain-containing protein n=1 Tax=Periconia macrospinosa TaxID=97972 RepID=A0A2V1DMA9_9PLEO|nr:hypothetical protein DM02DRAFT_673149 [Periconia macrospinosa]